MSKAKKQRQSSLSSNATAHFEEVPSTAQDPLPDPDEEGAGCDGESGIRFFRTFDDEIVRLDASPASNNPEPYGNGRRQSVAPTPIIPGYYTLADAFEKSRQFFEKHLDEASETGSDAPGEEESAEDPEAGDLIKSGAAIESGEDKSQAQQTAEKKVERKGEKKGEKKARKKAEKKARKKAEKKARKKAEKKARKKAEKEARKKARKKDGKKNLDLEQPCYKVGTGVRSGGEADLIRSDPTISTAQLLRELSEGLESEAERVLTVEGSAVDVG